MTVKEVLMRIDQQKQNTCTRQEKLAWLSELEGMVVTQVLAPLGLELPECLPYTLETPDNTTLLIRPPYDGLYLWWLEARIDYLNGEFIRCNNALDMFRNQFQQYAAWCNRTHSPTGTQFV